MTIDHLKRSEEADWDAFVMANGGTLFHLTGWKSLLEQFTGYKPRYLRATVNGEITAVLPLFLVHHPFFGRKMISVPYAVQGSVCANSIESGKRLVKYALSMARDEKVDYLELRDNREWGGPFEIDSRYATFHLDLSEGPDAIMKNMRKSHRRTIKKALASGLEVDLRAGDIDGFYRFYARDQHRFGTPVQGKQWIKGLFKAFPQYHSLASVVYQGQTIAIFMVRRFNGIVSEVIGNDLPEFRSLYPNQLLEWTLIQDGCRRGYHTYDFGRSMADSGPCQYKTGWGAEPRPFYYHFAMLDGRKRPDTSQAGSGRRRFSRVWSRIPLPVANWLGPKIRIRFP